MVRHIVCWKLKEEAEGRSKSENAKLICDRLIEMKKDIPEILEIEAGIDPGNSSGNWDIVLNSVFDSQQSLDIYQNHPKHLEFKEFIIKLRETRVAVDYPI